MFGKISISPLAIAFTLSMSAFAHSAAITLYRAPSATRASAGIGVRPR